MIPGALYADLVLKNGKVVTVDPEDSIAQAVAVKGNLIVAVGTDEDILPYVSEGTKIIDLERRTVLPGLTDPHLHMVSAGLAALREFRIPSTSIKDVLEVVKENATATPKGEWLRGGNIRFAHVKFAEKRWPTRWEIDAVAPDHPVFLHFGPHIKVVNTRALEMAGITRETPDPLGGHIVKDKDGEPTGVLRETSSHLVTKLWTPYSDEDRLEAIRLEGRRCLEEGVTTVHDIVRSPEEIRPYQELLARGELPIRVRLLVRVWESKIELDHLLALGIQSNFGDSWLKIAGVKMSVGGGMSGSNAALYEPYSDELENFGVIRIPYPDLVSLISRAHEGGLQCAVHAMGDRDLDMVMDAFEEAMGKVPERELRHRVEHAGDWFFTPERRHRFRELGLIAMPNINFIGSFGDGVNVTLGPIRSQEHAFPLKSMLEEEMLLVSGSDGPNLEPTAPLRDMEIAVVRRTDRGIAVNPSESIPLIEALKMFTKNAAYIEFEEDAKGSIEPGKLADLVVLSEDPFTVSPERLREIKVDTTIIDGKIGYMRKNH